MQRSGSFLRTTSQGHIDRSRSKSPGLGICRLLASLHTLLLVVTPGFGRLYLITKSGDTTLLLEPKVGAKYFKPAWKYFVTRVEKCYEHEDQASLKRAAGCIGIPTIASSAVNRMQEIMHRRWRVVRQAVEASRSSNG